MEAVFAEQMPSQERMPAQRAVVRLDDGKPEDVLDQIYEHQVHGRRYVLTLEGRIVDADEVRRLVSTLN